MTERSPLTDLRKALGFKVEEVALKAGWSIARQRALEAGSPLEAEEADRLSALLGADIEALLEEGTVQARPLARLLKGQAIDLDAGARFLLAEAATVAREIQQLKTRLELPVGLGPVAKFNANSTYSHPREGVPARLASLVRTKLGLGEGPLASVQETLLKPLGIVVLWVVLPETIDAVAMASEETGAVIVANPQGIHMKTASGRRVAFAHELCHLLFDRPEMHRFARACAMEGEPVGQQRDWFERVEQRARAFALALLAPEKAVKACWQRTQALSEELRVQEIMAYFGIGYQAARSHLHNHGLLDLQARLPGLPIASIQGLEGLDPLPPPSISPLLRSGVLRELATLAVRQGLVSPRWAEEQRWGPLQAPLVRASSEASAWGYRTTSMGVLEES